MQTRPNILLITTDQQRFDALGINNPSTSLQTPICDQLAATGTNFTRAYATCPVCIPARRSLISGLHPHTHGLRHYQDFLDWDPPFTLPGLLKNSGYHTALVGKLHLHPQRKRYGYDHMWRTESMNDRWDTKQHVNDWADWLKEQGITHPNNTGINGNGRVARPWDLDERYHQTSWLADRAVDFLTKYRDPSQPYFLHLSFFAPHPPLIPPQAYWDKYFGRHNHTPVMSDWTPRFDRIPRGIADDAQVGPFSKEEMHAAAAGYFGLINHIDDRIRFVLSRCFEYGSDRQKAPTLIMFTSDHGEMLGDHHLWRKSIPYEGSSHVPFFITARNMGKEFTRGTSDQLVCLEDIVATTLDAAGVPIPRELDGELEGKSLLPILRGEKKTVREQLFGECDNNHFIIRSQYKYCWFGRTNEEQLFDLYSDPYELHDLSANSDLLQPMRALLADHLKSRPEAKYDPTTATPCANKPPKYFWPNA